MTENEEKVVQAVLANLKEVIDPELGVDIVDLGLIYEIKIEAKVCTVEMTLTTMGCPVGELLASNIKAAVLAVEGIDECKIDLVWSPAWSMDRMSLEAKIALGIV
ncbi:metal-sulfur cluster assembly factor [Ligilactobacillus equi]|nr:metal-sulfur cluster assembly factor [Ligilactobacillus equi]